MFEMELTRLRDLEADWDSYGAEPPNELAIKTAAGVLEYLGAVSMPPTYILR